MKIAVTAKNKGLDSEIDPRFGRCPYFVIVDSETMEHEDMDNESASASGGTGPQAASAISRAGVNVLITGNVGPNAFSALKAAEITVITGSTGSVREMVEKYKSGSFETTNAPTAQSHNGMGK